MLGVNICAVGRLRQSPEAVLVSDYISRFNKLGRQLGLGPASIVEVEDKTNSGISAEATLLEKSIPKNSVVCILDENGKAMTSPDHAKLSDDPEAKSVIETMKQGIIMLGAKPGDSIEIMFDELLTKIQSMQRQTEAQG